MSNIIQDPNALWVHIEIVPECGPVKYEYDPAMGLVIDRFMKVPMMYPLPYGYAPNTLCGDGDALDVLVMTPFPVLPGCFIRVRPIGVMVMEDEKGMDEKLLAVPLPEVCHTYDYIKDLADVDKSIIDNIDYFFSRYKDLDHNKWVKIHQWSGFDASVKVITESMMRYESTLVQ